MPAQYLLWADPYRKELERLEAYEARPRSYLWELWTSGTTESYEVSGKFIFKKKDTGIGRGIGTHNARENRFRKW